MFDIGFTELLVIALVALVVLGPERLPHAIKVTAMWIGRIKRSFNSVKDEIEREIRVDDIRRDLHNDEVMEELRKAREKAEKMRSSVVDTMNETIDGQAASSTSSDVTGKPAADAVMASQIKETSASVADPSSAKTEKSSDS